MYIQLFGRKNTKYAVIYGAYIRFWPTLYTCHLPPLPFNPVPLPNVAFGLKPFGKTRSSPISLSSLLVQSCQTSSCTIVHIGWTLGTACMRLESLHARSISSAYPHTSVPQDQPIKRSPLLFFYPALTTAATPAAEASRRPQGLGHSSVSTSQQTTSSPSPFQIHGARCAVLLGGRGAFLPW